MGNGSCRLVGSSSAAAARRGQSGEFLLEPIIFNHTHRHTDSQEEGAKH